MIFTFSSTFFRRFKSSDSSSSEEFSCRKESEGLGVVVPLVDVEAFAWPLGAPLVEVVRVALLSSTREKINIMKIKVNNHITLIQIAPRSSKKRKVVICLSDGFTNFYSTNVPFF